MDIDKARRQREVRLRRCGSCGRKLMARADEREPFGLIEDGAALCRACAVEADRDYETPAFDAA